MMNWIAKEKLDAFREKFKGKGDLILAHLGKDRDFLIAIESDVGKELLDDSIKRTEDLFDKIASLHATDEEKIEYLVLVKILKEWGRRIALYEKRFNQVKVAADIAAKERS